jgi:acyl dehydratase
MESDSSYLGTMLKEHITIVTARHTMNYAAAVEDGNPFYFDDQRPGGVIAPPMFAVAANWPISARIGEFIEAEDFPLDLMKMQVHYTEHLSFHRPIIPGDELRIRGHVAAIVPHKGGTVFTVRYDAVDGDNKPVFIEHIGVLLRGVSCRDEGKGEETLPAAHPYDGRGKAPLWESVISVDALRPFVYDGCADIHFPIHTSERFARAVGLPGIILHGTATLAYAARELVNREADGNPLRLSELSCRFTGMVRPGSDIGVRVLDKNVDGTGKSLSFVVVNAEGKRAVSGGHARITPP